MSNFHYKINCCQSCSYQIAYAVNNEGVFMGPTQGPYILQLCMGPSYFWGVWPLLTPPLISHTGHARPLGSRIIRCVYRRQTDRQTDKSNAYCPFLTKIHGNVFSGRHMHAWIKLLWPRSGHTCAPYKMFYILIQTEVFVIPPSDAGKDPADIRIDPDGIAPKCRPNGFAALPVSIISPSFVKIHTGFQWYHIQWPCITPTPHFKVTKLFNVTQLENCTRQSLQW